MFYVLNTLVVKLYDMHNLGTQNIRLHYMHILGTQIINGKTLRYEYS